VAALAQVDQKSFSLLLFHFENQMDKALSLPGFYHCLFTSGGILGDNPEQIVPVAFHVGEIPLDWGRIAKALGDDKGDNTKNLSSFGYYSVVSQSKLFRIDYPAFRRGQKSVFVNNGGLTGPQLLFGKKRLLFLALAGVGGGQPVVQEEKGRSD